MASLPTISHQLKSPMFSSPLSSACPFQTHHRTKSRTPRPAKISCEAGRAGPGLDRRELLLGIGGACAAAATARENAALSLPIQAPDLSQCQRTGGSSGSDCCPPFKPAIVDYKFFPSGQIRVRPAAHTVDAAYIAKYKRAVELMRALPADDPRSFAQQANVHCAYCDNAYDQVGFPNLKLQVHSCWLFFPFHRYYLHFHERILGKLIGDESFALPFWNWDSPGGMALPQLFTDPSSSLYDRLRDATHQPPTLVDFDLSDGTTPQIQQNLSIMYRQMVSNARTTRLFMGQPYRAGGNPGPGAGSVEVSPHGPVHTWVGDSRQPRRENMGTFYSAARDPIFYAHHANVDRMWHLWKNLDKNNVDFKDNDWLETAFLFYDENKQLVRVKVKDCLEPEMLGFSYQEVEFPWINSRATPRSDSASASVQSLSPSSGKKKKRRSSLLKSAAGTSFPLTLSAPVSVAVRRPKISRDLTEEERKKEVLVVEGIEFDGELFVKFDVYVDDAAAGEVKPDDSEFAGSFVNVPRRNAHGMEMEPLKTALFLGISDLIEDLKLEDEEKLLVTLVPCKGKGTVKIGGLRIEISS